MFKNLRKIVLGLLAVCLTGALGAGVAFGIEAHAEEAVASVKAFKSTQINLNESITVRYNLTVPAGYTGAEMTFTVGEGGSPITAEPKTDLTDGQNITFELKNIGPQNMADKITATVTFTGKTGETGVETCKTSVKEYCQTLLKNAAAGKADGIDAQEKFDALKTLASSLLAYGDEAQKYVGKEASSTTGLTVAQKNAALKAQASSSDLSFSGEAYKGLLWSGATLWFGNKVNLIYYFKADSALQAQGTLGVKAGESFFEAQAGETVDGYTEYSATYEGLSVTEFDSVIGARVAYKTTDGVVTEVGKTANYSVKSYVLRAPEADKALAEAAYSYGVAAKAYTEALENTEAPANLGVMLEKGYGVLYNTELLVDYGTKLGSNFVYHTAYDGKNIFTLASASGAKKRVSRLSTETYAVEATSAEIGDISEQNVAMFVKDAYIYVVCGVYTTTTKDDGTTVSTLTGYCFKKLPTNFTAGANAEDATFTFGSLTTYQGIAYDETNGYAVLSDNKIYYFDKQFAQVGEAVSIPATQIAYDKDGNAKSVGTIVKDSGKRLSADSEYIYVNYWGGNTVTPSLLVLDWRGDIIGKQIVNVSSDIHKMTENKLHIQSALVIDKELYFTILSWGTPGNSALFKTTFAYNFNMSTGEYYEDNAKLEITNTLVEQITGNGITSTLHGFVIKDGYGYISSSAGGAADKPTPLKINVTKFDLVTGKTVGYKTVDIGYFVKNKTTNSDGTETITYVQAWEIKHNLFIYKDEIYLASVQDKKLYKTSLDGFTTSGGDLTEVTGFFGGATTYAEAVAYDEVSDRFAVRVGQNLYVGKKDSLKKIATTGSGTLTGLYSDNDYIYVLSETNGNVETAAVRMMIYTWDGIAVTSTWNTDIKPMNGAKSNNVQGMSVANGKVYFLVCQWGGGTTDAGINVSTGAYVVSGYFDTSKIA